MDILDTIIKTQKSGHVRGIPSICSAHPFVLESVFKRALQTGNSVLIEATSNQVNQFGGYTGMTPVDFVRVVSGMAEKLGFPHSRLVLGGDHLGPLPWVSETAEKALNHARELVRTFALAGFGKIHLDCSVSCTDDHGLAPEVMAERTAELAVVVEDACQEAGLPSPRYVIGTEVPAAGGAKAGEEQLQVTHPEDAARTIELTRKSFVAKGLDAAWERVIALVVQPGVEFGHNSIHEYDRSAAISLAKFIESNPNLVYEAHSTDYQRRNALQQLVEDHFAILKVGPGLTFAMREAIFALAEIEDRLCEQPSRIRQVLEEAMLANPSHWQKHYPGTMKEQKFNREFSFSDRIRYYWNVPEVRLAFDQMMIHLGQASIPLTLLSQYFPQEYVEVREGELKPSPRELVLRRITRVLEDYEVACRG
jgi:D-tagatose-1,6-bisphosphate aldolase subunit GatZ/KbaZ